MSLDSRSYRFESSPSPVPAPASVLVAEDDPALRELVCRRLVDEGFEVHCVASGIELLNELERLSSQAWPASGVDLIISDLRMPGATGLDAIRKLRREHWLVPAILMTAFPNTLVQIEAAHLGVEVLAKPFALDGLLQFAFRALNSSALAPISMPPFRVPGDGPRAVQRGRTPN
jgi:CheY-like chemotaxis protein